MANKKTIKEIFDIVKKARYAKRVKKSPSTIHHYLLKMDVRTVDSISMFCREEAARLVELSEMLESKHKKTH